MRNERMEFYDFRAAYLAAGPGAAAALADAYAPIPVDADAVAGALNPDRLETLAEANVNFVICPFDLGVPPGEARAQKDAFARLAADASRLGMEALALVSTSVYTARGEWKNAPWKSLLPNGKPVFYSRAARRAMACWANEEWAERTDSAVRGALGAGAAGVFLDFICFGAAPVIVGGDLFGPAGCQCEVCRKKFGEHLDEKNKQRFPIPREASFRDEQFKEYASWRQSVVMDRLISIGRIVKDGNEANLLGAIVPHLPYLPALPVFGFPTGWAYGKNSFPDFPDICCVEHQRATELSRNGLLYESPGLKVLRASSAACLVASLAHQPGPAPDRVPSAGRYASGIISAFASGVAPIIRAGEFRDAPYGKNGKNGKNGKVGDYLCAPQYAEQRETIASLFNWLDKNRDLFEGAAPVARVGVYFEWGDLYSTMSSEKPSVAAFYNIVQTLTETQIPVNVLPAEKIDLAAYADLRVVIIPGAECGDSIKTLARGFPGVHFVFVGGAPDWAAALDNCSAIDASFMDAKETRGARFAESFIGRRLIKRLYAGRTGHFGGFPISRRASLPPPLLAALPAMNYQHLPSPGWKKLRDAVADALKRFPDDVTIEAPPYIHVHEWKKPPNALFHVIHLLPGFKGPDQAALRFPAPVSARIIDAARNKITYIKNEATIAIKPEPYVVVEVKDRYR